MQRGHSQAGDRESRGEQQLGEDLAFMRMMISLVVAWVVCCHGYKARCNPCVQVEPSLVK